MSDAHPRAWKYKIVLAYIFAYVVLRYGWFPPLFYVQGEVFIQAFFLSLFVPISVFWGLLDPVVEAMGWFFPLWNYVNALELKYLSRFKKYRAKSNDYNGDFNFAWNCELCLICEKFVKQKDKGESLVDASLSQEDREALKNDFKKLRPLAEQRLNSWSAGEPGRVDTKKILLYKKAIEYIDAEVAKLERERVSAIDEEHQEFSKFIGEYTISRQERKAIAVTIRLDGRGEYQIYRRDGRQREHLGDVRGGREKTIELVPPAQGGRIEIIKEETGELDYIRLS